VTDWWDTGHDRAAQDLAFTCTMCGNCCTGPEGFVVVSDQECHALARRLGITPGEFVFRHTRMNPRGRSLRDVVTRHGHDCVFLDRTAVPGRAVCGVYEDRPAQCRSWPYWPSNLASPEAWRRARAICPGIGAGTPPTLHQVRVSRDAADV
jgi:uncharacterized protein